MKKNIVLFACLTLSAVIIFISINQNYNKYFKQVNSLWNDYDLLFIEIVEPSLAIEGVDEFMDYFLRDEILQKVDEAEIILEKIQSMIDEHKLDILRPTSQTLYKLKNLTELKDTAQDIDVEMINTIINIRQKLLKNDVEIRKNNIEIYNEFFGDD